MTTDEIQNIINYAYPKIQKYYGKGSLDIPKIEFTFTTLTWKMKKMFLEH